MHSNHGSSEKTPVCIVSLSQPVLEHLVSEYGGKKAQKQHNPFDQEVPKLIVRGLEGVGRVACGSSCGIACVLETRHPHEPRHPGHQSSIEIDCNKNNILCRNIGVIAVSTHVLKLSRSRKVLQKIKKVSY